MDEDNRKTLKEEVLRGHEFAQQLQQIFVSNCLPNELLAQNLFDKLLNSFTNTLFLLDINKLQPTHIHTPTNKSHRSQINHLSFSTTSSTISSAQESCSLTSSSPEDHSKKRRKRKTTETSSSWQKVCESPTDDGQQWRKYGQKIIMNSKYTRNYYRCSHKFEQNCQATKQVQRIQEKPPLYKTTYYGHHICNNPNIIIDHPTSSCNTAIMLSFDNPTKNQYLPFLSSDQDQLPSSSSDQAHLTVQSSSTLESDDKDTDIIHDLLCDSFDFDNFIQTFDGFS